MIILFIKVYEKVKRFFLENYKFFIVLILLCLLFTYELPYVVYTPGGIINLESRIEVEDGYESSGSLNMSYVSLRKGTIPMILLSFIMPNWDLVEESSITVDEDDSVDDLLELEKLYMQTSLDSATILAYEKANKELTITKEVNTIVYISDDAITDVLLYDEIISVDGSNINSIDELRDIVNVHEVGDKLNIVVNRDGEEVECSAEVVLIDGELKVGLAFLVTYEFYTDPDITITTKESESGSSGGLMLSLAIYNALVSEDITGGKVIVGTGTIDTEGNVGEIDGVKYKLLGTASSNADLFLCPKENYTEAISVKEEYDLDIEIVGVSTFDEALEAILDN